MIKTTRLIIGNKGENNAYKLKFDIPEEYQDGNIYFDFSLPNGLITQTPPIPAPYEFSMPYEMLTSSGFGWCNVVYKKGDVKKVIAKADLQIMTAINADTTIIVKYHDVVEDLQERVTRLEDSGLPADATSIDGISVNLDGMADGQAIGLVDGELKPVDKGGGTAATINGTAVEGDLTSEDIAVADRSHRHDISDIDGMPEYITADNIIAGTNVTIERNGDNVTISASGGGGGTGSDELWKPSVTVEGDLSWVKSTSTETPETVNIKGADGVNGIDGTNGTDGKSAYEIAVEQGFIGTESEWLASLKGAKGDTGAKGATGDKGDTGENGTDGKQVELQKSSTYIQWKYDTETAWNNLIALSELKGEKGDTGNTGANGTDGKNGTDGVTPHINEADKHWYIGETDTGIIAEGKDGESAIETLTAGNGISITEPTPKNYVISASGGGGGGDIPDYAGRITVQVSTSDGGSFGDTKVVVRNEALGAYYVHTPDSDGTVVLNLLENRIYNIYLINYPDTYFGAAEMVAVATKDNKTVELVLEDIPDTVGFEINEIDGTVTYTDLAVDYLPMSMSTGTIDYGNWQDNWLIRNIRPCLLKNGVVQYYLNPNDYTKKADGTAADITSGADGDVMIEFPKVYYQVYNTTSGWGCRFSQLAQDGFEATAWLNREGVAQDVFYMSAYDGYNNSGKMASLSGKIPTVSIDLTTSRTIANAKGTGYEQQEKTKRDYLTALFYLLFKGLDSQTLLGKGVTSASAKVDTGTMNDKGMFWGDQTGTNGVKFCGIEHFWGNIRKWCDGLLFTSNTYYTKTYAPYADVASTYISRGTTTSTTSGEWITKVSASSNVTGLLPNTTNSSTNTIYCDRFYKNTTSSLYGYVTGGLWANTADAGVLYFVVDFAVAGAGAGLGCSLSYTPV